MNVNELVRSGRPGISPGWARSDGGQRVLDEVIKAAPAGSEFGRTAWARAVARRSALRWSVVGTGLVGAAAVVALVVPAIVATSTAPTDGRQVSGAPGGTSGNSGGDATTLGPREILLAAATSAERAPAETGKYWHVKKLSFLDSIRVGIDPKAYRVVRREVVETWHARDSKDASWSGHRDIGVRPRDEADEKAWRAAGSPTEWRLNSGGDTFVLSTQPGAGQLWKDSRAARYLGDLGPLSLEQVRQLPEDQKALRGWVTGRIQTQMGWAPGSAESDQVVFSALSEMLLDTPATPKVRASAFRILADISGVRGLGTVRDESGRSGLGVEFTRGGYSERLIIDASTHLLLADRISSRAEGATKERSTLVLTAKWSDAAPQVPSIPER